MSFILASYSRALAVYCFYPLYNQVHPIITKMTTSFVLGGCGDLIAQRLVYSMY